MFTWFMKVLTKLLKLLFTVLPLTALIFTALLGFSVYLLFSKDAGISTSATTMYTDLRIWWLAEVYTLKGSLGYIILLFLTILMFVPVITVLLSICVFVSFGSILFIGVVLDAALYLVRAVFGKSFVAQALDRYYRLFPDAGRKHEERRHDRLLKQRNRQLEDEIRQAHDKKLREFYEDSEDGYDDQESADEYDRRHFRGVNARHDVFYSDEEYEADGDDFYEDEEYEDEYDEEYLEDSEYDEEYEDEDGDQEYDRGRSQRGSLNNGSSAFNFFAGCNSRESADRKYKSLVKLYHPDNMDGDTAALQEINAQYAEVKKRL